MLKMCHLNRYSWNHLLFYGGKKLYLNFIKKNCHRHIHGMKTTQGQEIQGRTDGLTIKFLFQLLKFYSFDGPKKETKLFRIAVKGQRSRNDQGRGD